MAYYNPDRANGLTDEDVQLMRDLFRVLPHERHHELRQRIAKAVDDRIAAGRELDAERARKVM